MTYFVSFIGNAWFQTGGFSLYLATVYERFQYQTVVKATRRLQKEHELSKIHKTVSFEYVGKPYTLMREVR